MLRVVHFEITASDPDRAAKFYGDVFGWKIEKWDGPMEYWMIMTGERDQPGINGGMMRGDAPSTVNTVDVPSVDEYVEKITASGGKVAVPKQAIPGVGYFAYLRDTEGNTFGIMQSDESAGA